jgi:uncharacterized YccA/Bax inhibitor family protein
MDTSSNPVFANKAITRFKETDAAGTMTMAGSVAKTAFAMALLMAAAVVGWMLFPKIGVTIAWGWLVAFLIATPIVGIVTAFKPSAQTVALYAVMEGLVLGVASKAFESAYDGIVLQAILLTLAMTVGMLILFATGAVKVTAKFRSVIMIATFGVLIYLLFEFIISLFSPGFLTIVTSGPWGIVIAAVIVLIAALNLLLDFDFISKGAEQGLAKKTEWYAAFGLMVTLIWLYISILRLLAASRR